MYISIFILTLILNALNVQDGTFFPIWAQVIIVFLPFFTDLIFFKCWYMLVIRKGSEGNTAAYDAARHHFVKFVDMYHKHDLDAGIDAAGRRKIVDDCCDTVKSAKERFYATRNAEPAEKLLAEDELLSALTEKLNAESEWSVNAVSLCAENIEKDRNMLTLTTKRAKVCSGVPTEFDDTAWALVEADYLRKKARAEIKRLFTCKRLRLNNMKKWGVFVKAFREF